MHSQAQKDLDRLERWGQWQYQRLVHLHIFLSSVPKLLLDLARDHLNAIALKFDANSFTAASCGSGKT
jgi:hypothetical protein